MQLVPHFPAKQKIKRIAFSDAIQEKAMLEGDAVQIAEETTFKNDVFYVIIDSMIVGLLTRYTKLIVSLGSSRHILP